MWSEFDQERPTLAKCWSNSTRCWSKSGEMCQPKLTHFACCFFSLSRGRLPPHLRVPHRRRRGVLLLRIGCRRRLHLGVSIAPRVLSRRRRMVLLRRCLYAASPVLPLLPVPPAKAVLGYSLPSYEQGGRFFVRPLSSPHAKVARAKQAERKVAEGLAGPVRWERSPPLSE